MPTRRNASSGAPLPSRPEGKVLWVHATTHDRLLALRDLARRLHIQRSDLTLLTTWEEDMWSTSSTEANEICVGTLPDDIPADCRAFLDTWKPDLCIWAGGKIRRTLMRFLQENDLPALLVDVLEEDLPLRSSRWWPDHRTRTLNSFSEILTPSQSVADHLERSGISAHRLSLTGPLSVSSTPPGFANDDLSHMQKILASRPVWLASHVKLEELTTILNAHRKALKLLHRLLLVVSMDNWADLQAARAIIQDTGLSMADWEAGDDPSETNQILLGDGEDLGLWYRLAPVALIAGSLERSFTGNNPLDAAALGSAILFGKGVSDHGTIYQQLKRQGAARQVRSMGELADEVIRLSSPDIAASMALAGWKMVTKGAQATDKLLEITQDLLDMPEAADETA